MYFLRKITVATGLFLIAVFSASPLLAGEALLRFPDVYGEQIVFVSGDDIWMAPLSGGAATRLTMHDGSESNPKFSKDGQLIAFTAAYDGNADVYVMNSKGGDITRVTYHPGTDRVIGWNAIKNKILFSSSRDGFGRSSRLYLINPDGSELEKLILHEAAQGSFSGDGSKIAYNRVSREFSTWKRYRGGTAQEVYLYDLNKNEEKNITNFKGTDRIPMWVGNKIYFSSDRDRTLNIFSYNTESGITEQVTKHNEWDVRFSSAGANHIVYELGGDIWALDLKTKVSAKIDIKIETDAPELRPYFKNVSDFVTNVSISPSGKRALVEARGEIFSVPQKDGPTRNLTNSSASRDKDAIWSPDGKTIAFISDRNGEYQIYTRPADGKRDAKQLTNYKDGYRHSLRWSPDNKMLAFTDQTLTLYILDLTTKKITSVDKAEYENIDVSVDLKPIYDYAWSPDSRYITYSKMDASLLNKIFIYSLDNKKSYEIGNGLFNNFHPVFSKDGEHLFFISNRRFDPTFGDMEWEMVYKNIAGIYALTLRKDGPALLGLQSDEEGSDEASKKENKTTQVKIDFQGLNNRIEALPLEPGNYRYLTAIDDALFFLNKEKGDFNRFEFRSHQPMDLYAFSFKDREHKKVIEKVNSYRISHDGSQIAYRQNLKVGMIASSERESKGNLLNLDMLNMWFEPMAEWKQIFNESWRMERDFYYDQNMHGLDWSGMHKKYNQMLTKATCRQDARYVIGELIGELNTSHTYVFGGDRQRRSEGVGIGLLGADFEVDQKAQRYRFKTIHRVPEWLRSSMPPIFGPEKNISEGDYLLQVNGQPVSSTQNIYSYFTGLDNQQVQLTVNSKPELKGARRIKVQTTSSEFLLRYLTWVEHNRQIVDKASDGQIGYLHLPDTYTRSAQIFPKYFYGQTTKKGLIIDGRYNGGGLDPDIFLQRLHKRPLTFWTRRYSNDYFSPWLGTQAHMVCLTNRQAGSGGDEVPYLFRLKGMGPVIGTRSWGGLVGVSMFYRLIDGGGLSAPDYRIYDAQGNWIIENEGVTPDIEIDLKPAEMAKGYDAQLMKAVEVLEEKIKKDPKPWPKHQVFPIDK